jgi:hypothetical protein
MPCDTKRKRGGFIPTSLAQHFIYLFQKTGKEACSFYPHQVAIDAVHKKPDVHFLGLDLHDLSLTDVEWIVEDSFRCEDEARNAELAALLFQKTGGNPFFLNQLMRSITNDRHVSFNYTTHQWEWSIEELRNIQYPFFSFFLFFSFSFSFLLFFFFFFFLLILLPLRGRGARRVARHAAVPENGREPVLPEPTN